MYIGFEDKDLDKILDRINSIYNKTKEIYFDNENIYLLFDN